MSTVCASSLFPLSRLCLLFPRYQPSLFCQIPSQYCAVPLEWNPSCVPSPSPTPQSRLVERGVVTASVMALAHLTVPEALTSDADAVMGTLPRPAVIHLQLHQSNR